MNDRITGYVYRVTNRYNGKKYVGYTTKSIEKRWRQHIADAKSGKRTNAIHSAILLYGEHSFVVECIEIVYGCHADLRSAEVRQIKSNGCTAPHGYNLTSGGDGVDFSVQDTKQRHAEAMERVKNSTSFKETMQRVKSDPQWKRNHNEGLQRMHARPEHKEALRERTRRMHMDPAFAAARDAKFAETRSRPEFKEAQRTVAVNNLKWKASNSAQLKELHKKQAIEMDQRDKQLSEEELLRKQVKRSKNLDAVRRYRKKKRSETY